MPKMSLELTDSLQSFVDAESSQQGFASGTDFVLDLIKKEQGRVNLRALVDEGMASPARVICVEDYIDSLRDKINGKKDL